jgi:hypothetical protein
MSNLTQHPSALSPADDNSPTFFDDLPPECEETRPVTPVIKRIASIRLPHDHSEKELAELAPMLQFDLDGNIIDSVPDLFDVLFPDEILPFSVNVNLLNSLSPTLYDRKGYKWKLDNAKTESVSKSFITEHLDCRNSLYTEILLVLE